MTNNGVVRALDLEMIRWKWIVHPRCIRPLSVHALFSHLRALYGAEAEIWKQAIA